LEREKRKKKSVENASRKNRLNELSARRKDSQKNFLMELTYSILYTKYHIRYPEFNARERAIEITIFFSLISSKQKKK